MSNINRQLSGFRLVNIKANDTLQIIAARELGDANQWRNLITINNLAYPYITGDPTAAGPRVKLWGQLISVPAPQPIANTQDPDDVFGTDMLLQDGYLTDDGNGDIATVSGPANYKQALQNRLNTPQGQLIYHLPYGSPIFTLLGTVNGPTAVQLAAAYGKAVAAADDRTLDVNSSVATAVGDAIVTNVEVQPIAGTPINVTATN